MTWRQRCEEIANQLPGGFEADTQMLEFLQVAIKELQQQIQHEEIAEFIAREGIGNRQIQAGIKRHGSIEAWHTKAAAEKTKQELEARKVAAPENNKVNKDPKNESQVKNKAGASKIEAQALAEAKQRAAFLTASSPQTLSENGTTEALSLSDCLDRRQGKIARRKGVAQFNQIVASASAFKREVCRKFYQDECRRRQRKLTYAQVYQALKPKWKGLTGQSRTNCPALKTFQKYCTGLCKKVPQPITDGGAA
tara:strand:+ start:1187 stop:1942 length:756 start_codon:yes stop_codon:yes gene_type:complete